jgi:hypothetical protein
MARTHHLLTVLLLSSAPAGASPSTPHSPPPDSDVPQALRDLRAALIDGGRDKVAADLARFRPLCDKDGYPLVGNIANKRDRYQPSQFCSDLRKREKLS